MAKKKKKWAREDVKFALSTLKENTGWASSALIKLLEPNKAKGKGSQFERDTCRLLSMWWSGQERDDLFWRSSQSGGRATQRAKKGKETFGQYGDITATHPDGFSLLSIFTMELKNGYSKHHFMNMLDKKEPSSKQMWEGFFDQVTTDAEKAKSMTWMIIWKRDGKVPLVYVSTLIIKKLKTTCPSLKKIPNIVAKVRLKDKKKVNIYICRLEDFLDVVKPKYIKGLK